MPSTPRLSLLQPAVATVLVALWCTSAFAGAATTLGTCQGTVGEKKESKSVSFKLKAETAIKLSHEVSANPGDAVADVVARLQRKLPNGSFVTIKTLSNLTGSGETESKSYPAGEYRLEVTASHAKFTVSAKKVDA